MFPEPYKCKFSFLRETWIKLVSQGAENAAEYAGVNNSTNRRMMTHLTDASRSSFSGASPQAVKDYCLQGYKVPGLESIDPGSLPVRKKRKPVKNDCEGEFSYEDFLSGDDRPYTDWTKREQVPGIDISMSMGFLADTPASVISEYNRFVLQALLAIETAGIDYSLTIFNRGRHRFRGYGGESEFRVTVKSQGEKTDYLSWSAMLAPGSYRTLGFLALILSAEHNQRSIGSGFGGSITKEWAVKYDKTAKSITFNQSASANRFPLEKMTRELIDALAQAKG